MHLSILLLVLLAGGVLLIGLWVNKRLNDLAQNQKPSDDLLQIMKMLQESGQEDRKVLLTTLQRNTESMNERLDNAAKVIGDVQKNIGEMSEIGRSMRDLQAFLSSPKLRGNIGEQVLNELLRQMLPKNSFHLQYGFKSGEKVDAAIKTAAGMVPIDSKFPMENFRKMMIEGEGQPAAAKQFRRDVKKHIDSISKKYILTEEGTIDYALMYIPSEAVYYEIVNDADLFEYAGQKRVLPVSPTTFYAYMRAILMSFEGQKIEQKAKEVLGAIRAIQKDYGKVEENIGKLGRHMTNANNMFGNVLASFEKLGQKINSTKRLGESVKEEAKILEE